MKRTVLFAALIATADAAGKILATRRAFKHTSHTLQAVDPASNIQFKLHFKQCNLDKLEAAAIAVSDPNNKRSYGKYVSSTDACEMTLCSDNAAAITAVVDFIAQADGAVADVECDHVKVSLSAGMCWQIVAAVRWCYMFSILIHKYVLRRFLNAQELL
jgi:Pro-kumamolisin, activation domain